MRSLVVAPPPEIAPTPGMVEGGSLIAHVMDEREPSSVLTSSKPKPWRVVDGVRTLRKWRWWRRQSIGSHPNPRLFNRSSGAVPSPTATARSTVALTELPGRAPLVRIAGRLCNDGHITLLAANQLSKQTLAYRRMRQSMLQEPV